MDVKLDVAALASAIVWPAILGVLAYWYREPLARLVAELPKRVKKLSIAGVDIEFADAKSAKLTLAEGRVDLRRSGTSGDVNDSTLASFYAQIRDPSRIDYAVVDLGSGREWLSSRLYILSVVMRRMRGLQALAIVETTGDVRRKLVGVCSCEQIRWRIAAKWPRFEAALASAELALWGHPYATPNNAFAIDVVLPWAPAPAMPLRIGAFQRDPNLHIVNTEGRIEGSTEGIDPAAATLLRAFLDAIQRPEAPPTDEWESLQPNPELSEYATWLNGALIEQILQESMDKRSIRVSDFQGWNDQERVRALVEHPGDWVAFTRQDGTFDRLVQRREIVENIASQAVRGAAE